MDLDDLKTSILKMETADLEECIRMLRHNRTEPDIVEKVIAKTRQKKDVDLAAKLLKNVDEATLLAMLQAQMGVTP